MPIDDKTELSEEESRKIENDVAELLRQHESSFMLMIAVRINAPDYLQSYRERLGNYEW